MHRLGAVQLAGLARPADHVEVGGDWLSGRRLGQDLEQRGDVREAFDDLLDAGDRNVHTRCRRAQAAVALVLDQAQGAGLGDREIHTGNTGIGGGELFAQDQARTLGQLVDVVGVRDLGVEPMKQLGHLAAVLVDRRGDDVRRGLLGQLDDELTQVGFDHLDAVVLEVVIELGLFGDHRFAFDDRTRAGRGEDSGNDRVRLLRPLGPVHLDPVLSELRLEAFEQFGLADQRIGAYFAGLFAQGLQLDFVGELALAFRLDAAQRRTEIAPQLVVVQGLVDAALKGAGLVHVRSHRNSAICWVAGGSAPGSPTGAVACWCAKAPPMFIRQPQS